MRLIDEVISKPKVLFKYSSAYSSHFCIFLGSNVIRAFPYKETSFRNALLEIGTITLSETSYLTIPNLNEYQRKIS